MGLAIRRSVLACRAITRARKRVPALVTVPTVFPVVSAVWAIVGLKHALASLQVVNATLICALRVVRVKSLH